MDPLQALLRRHLGAAWPYRWLGLGAAWIICLAGWTVLYLIPNQFEVNARLYVDTDAVLTPLLRGIAADSSPATQLEILERTLLSRPNLDKLIGKTSLDLSVAGPYDRERLIQTLGHEIKVSSETKTLFTISYRNPNPKLAHDVVESLLNIFIESATGTNRTDMENARRFIDQQIASYEQQLRAAERRQAEFRTKYVDLLPDANGGASRLDLAREQLTELEGRLQDATLRRDALKQELSATPQNLPVETDAAGLLVANPPSRLKAAQDQLREMQLRLTDQHPDVIAQKDLIATLQKEGAGGGAPARTGHVHPLSNPIYQQLKMKLVDAEGLVSSLQRQVQDAHKELDRLEMMARAVPGVQAEAENLDRDYHVLRRHYEELLDRRESASIAQAANTQADKVKLTIVDPPQIPRLPVSPNRPLLLPAVLLLGLAGGCGVAFLLGQMDRSFRTLDDLRALGLPVLGGISMLATVPVGRKLGSALGFSAAVLLLVGACGGLLGHVLRLSVHI
jgi:polysaccharide chain length determinant protein (PEP-CTERM system associated)